MVAAAIAGDRSDALFYFLLATITGALAFTCLRLWLMAGR
jgi:hypothetical protein